MRARVPVFVVLPLLALSLLRCVGADPSTGNVGTMPDGGGGGGLDGTTPGNDGASGNDATLEDSPSTDGADAALPPCDLAKPFGLVTLLPGQVNGTAADENARLSEDGKELYFSRKPAGGGNNGVAVFRATRSTTAWTDPWGSVGIVTELSTIDGGVKETTAPILTTDMKTMFFQLYPGDGYSYVYTSTRASTSATWGAPGPVNGPNTSGGSDSVYISRDANTLWFMKFNGGEGRFRIYFSTKSGNDFGGPNQQPGLNDEDRAPVVTSDDLTLYFTSYVPRVDGGASRRRPFKATRTSKSLAFTNPTLVTELNADDGDTTITWVSPDGCSVLLSSNRTGASFYDVYYAVKPQ